MLNSTRQHPIQGCTWSDFSAKPDQGYTYEVFALRGAPTSPQLSEKVAVKIRTESEHGRTHHVHFNRGAAASQEYTRLFGDKRPERSEEHTSELQSHSDLVCRLLLEKKK